MDFYIAETVTWMGNTVGDNVIVMNDAFPVNVVKENCCTLRDGCTKTHMSLEVGWIQTFAQ